MSAEILVKLLKDVLQVCNDVGLHVMNTICDTGLNNVKDLKLLGAPSTNPHFRYKDTMAIKL